MTRLAVATSLLVLGLAAMAGPVAAADGSLRVGSLVHDGDASEQGGLAMLFVLNGEDSAATPWIAGTAAQVRAVEYVQTWEQPDLPVDHPLLPVANTPPQTEEPLDTTFTLANLKLAGRQPFFELHAFPQGGAIDYAASSDRRTLEPRATVSMGAQFMDEADPSISSEDKGTESNGFATVERAGPLVLHAGDPSHTSLDLRGDFILEIYGLTLDLQGAEGERVLASGQHREATVDGAPGAVHVRDVFVRLFLVDAHVTVAMDGGEPRVEYATAAVTLEPVDTVTLYNSYGRVGDQLLNGERYVLPAGNVLAVVPDSEGLAVEVSEAKLGTRGTIADVPAPASAALVGTGAVLALAVAVGIGLLRRVLRLPQLAEVERAIEEGEYGRAARMAARIIARRPSDESAILARAIALSKAGQQRLTVAELSAHLARASASDGSLHYVLGLAQLDLGQKDAGRTSLREAVRLTPSLSAEVGSRLGKAFSPPTSTTKETSGYA